jgi:hypothetical protein
MKRVVVLMSASVMVGSVACMGNADLDRALEKADLASVELAPQSLVPPPSGTYVCEIDLSELIPTVASRAVNVSLRPSIFNPSVCDIRFTLVDTCTCVAPVRPNPACAGPTACVPNYASAIGFVYDYARGMTSVPAPPTGQVYDVSCNLSEVQIAQLVAREVERRAQTWQSELRAECSAACATQFGWRNAIMATQPMTLNTAQCTLPPKETVEPEAVTGM